ncbi:MAG: C80 family cysteine peptidase, partial [Desulfobacterales bacterium]|nr:C80 family cysteine peptidase [Desulfobacterales bacterium]
MFGRLTHGRDALQGLNGNILNIARAMALDLQDPDNPGARLMVEMGEAVSDFKDDEPAAYARFFDALKRLKTEEPALYEAQLGAEAATPARAALNDLYTTFRQLDENGFELGIAQWELFDELVGFQDISSETGMRPSKDIVNRWITGDTFGALKTFDALEKATDLPASTLQPVKDLFTSFGAAVGDTPGQRLSSLVQAELKLMERVSTIKTDWTEVPSGLRDFHDAVAQRVVPALEAAASGDLGTPAQQQNLLDMARLASRSTDPGVQVVAVSAIDDLVADYGTALDNGHLLFDLGRNPDTVPGGLGQTHPEVAQNLYGLGLISQADFQNYMRYLLAQTNDVFDLVDRLQFGKISQGDFLEIVSRLEFNTPGGADTLYGELLSELAKRLDANHQNEPVKSVLENLGYELQDAISRSLLTDEGRDALTGLWTDHVLPLQVTDLNGTPLISSADGFKAISHTDRIGFEEEFTTKPLAEVGAAQGERKAILGATADRELNIPVMRLEVDSVQAGYIYLELVTGPLRSAEYQDPAYLIAKSTLYDAISEAGKGTTVKAIIDTYNANLSEKMGAKASRYLLEIPEDSAASGLAMGYNSKLTPGYMTDNRNIQATVNMAIGDIGSQGFIQGAASVGYETQATQAAEVTDRIMAEMDPQGTMATEVRALVYTYVFNEYLGAGLKEGFYSLKTDFNMLFRFSPEDIIFGVLSDTDLTAVKSWYDNGGKDFMAGEISHGLGEKAAAKLGTYFTRRMDDVFSTNVGYRLDNDRVQLLVHLDGSSDFSPIDGNLAVHHTHPNPESRASLGFDGEHYYGAVEFRSTQSALVNLVKHPEAWMEGPSRDLVTQLMAGEVSSAPDDYTRTVAGFLDEAVQAVSIWSRKGGLAPGSIETGLNQLEQALPPERQRPEGESRSTLWNILLDEAWQRILNTLGDNAEAHLPALTTLSQKLDQSLGFAGSLPPVEDPSQEQESEIYAVEAFLDGEYSPQEFADEVKSLSRSLRLEAVNAVLTANADEHPYADFAAAQNLLISDITEFYLEDALSSQARLTVETAAARVRGDESLGFNLDEESSVRLTLDAIQARLLQETQARSQGSRTDYDGDGVAQEADVNGFYFSEVFSLDKPQWLEDRGGANPPDWDGIENAHVTELAHQWESSAGSILTSDQATAYSQLAQALTEGELTLANGEPAAAFVALVMAPDQETLVAMALYSVDETTGKGELHALVTDPAALDDSPVSTTLWEGAARQALLTSVQDLLTRFDISGIGFETALMEHETLARELFFRPQGAEALFEAAASTGTSHGEALSFILAGQLEVLGAVQENLYDIQALVMGLDGVTRQAIVGLKNQIDQISADMVGADAHAMESLGNQVNSLQLDAADLALKTWAQVPQTFEGAAKMELVNIRNMSRISPDAAQAFYGIKGALPQVMEGYLVGLNDTPPSREGLVWLLDSMSEYMAPEDFAQTVGSVLESTAVDSAASRMDNLIVDVLQGLQDSSPEHVAAVVSDQPWLKDRLTTGQDLFVTDTRYDTQWVVALATDTTVMDAARALYDKHPDSSRLLTWDGETLTSLEGHGILLGSNSRLSLVGHGTPSEIENLSPEKLVQMLVDQKVLASGDRLGRISFVGCDLGNMADPDGSYLSSGFAIAALRELDGNGVTVSEASVRTGLVKVDEFGQKWTGTFNSEGQVIWSRKDHQAKLVVTRDPDGGFGIQEVAGSHGDLIQVTGDTENALKAAGQGQRVRFQDGIQVDENGAPLSPFESGFLTNDQVETIHTRLGDGFSGDLWIDGNSFAETVETHTDPQSWLAVSLDPAAVDPGTGTNESEGGEEDLLHAEKEILDLTEQTLEWSRLADQAEASVVKLLAENDLSDAWMPDFDSLEENGDGSYSIRFINTEDPDELRILVTEDATLMEFKEFLDTHLEKVGSAYDMDTSGDLHKNNDATDAESVDGLNAAFTIQYILNYVQQKQKGNVAGDDVPQNLAIALEVHNYSMMAQLAHGVAMDAVHVVKLVKTLVSGETEAAETAVSTFGKALGHVAGEGLGLLFGVANVVLDSYELSQANTEAEKAVFGTQLAFDSAGLALTTTAVIAGLAGAATVSAVVGGVGAIVAGIGIGAAALAENYVAIANSAEAIGDVFHQIDEGYANGGFSYDSDNDLLSPEPGAIVDTIDFRTNTVTFGSQKIYGSSHGSTGSGAEDYFFWAGDFPVVDEDSTLYVRDQIGYAQTTALNHHDAAILVLPGTPNTFFNDYEWNTLPGSTTKNHDGFDALRRMEEGGDFDFDFYIFPSEYIIDDMDVSYSNHTVTVKLDHRDRTLAVPDFPDDYQGKTSYNIHGQGGSYVIAPNEHTHGMTLVTDGDNASTWLIN